MSLPANAPHIGTATQGGFVGAYISLTQDGVPTHALIVADKATEVSGAWGGTGYTVSNQIDGPGNFQTMLANNAAAAVSIQSDLNNAGHGGYSDWYLPALLELHAIYWELKPTSFENRTDSSALTNDYAVPQRPAPTASVPGQTPVLAFQAGGGQDYRTCDNSNPANCSTTHLYWVAYKTTTGDAAHFFSMGTGVNASGLTGVSRRIRAIRRVPIDQLLAHIPETPEELFGTDYDYATGAEPYVSALRRPQDVQRLADHHVITWLGQPGWYTMTVHVGFGEFALCAVGRTVWVQDDAPGLADGAWLKVMGRAGGKLPGPVRLLLWGGHNND